MLNISKVPAKLKIYGDSAKSVRYLSKGNTTQRIALNPEAIKMIVFENLLIAFLYILSRYKKMKNKNRKSAIPSNLILNCQPVSGYSISNIWGGVKSSVAVNAPQVQANHKNLLYLVKKIYVAKNISIIASTAPKGSVLEKNIRFIRPLSMSEVPI